MKFLLDFFPILLFFIAYQVYDIYVATAVAIITSVIQVGWFRFKHRRTEAMHLTTPGLLVVFGGLTIFCRTVPSSCGSHPSSTGCSQPFSWAATSSANARSSNA